MSMVEISIGVIDSGVNGPLAKRLAAARSFTKDHATDDAVGHGTRVTELIAEQAGFAKLINARVFGPDALTQPVVVAKAIDWLIGQRVKLINMSFGLIADRHVLADACRRADRSGIIMIASAPAQGVACYPSSYERVIAVTGDARCRKGEVSQLGGTAQFGTWCASPEHEARPSISGASVAAAHFAGLAGRWLRENPAATRDELLAHFRATAGFRGPERRGSGGARPWNS